MRIKYPLLSCSRLYIVVGHEVLNIEGYGVLRKLIWLGHHFLIEIIIKMCKVIKKVLEWFAMLNLTI